MTSQDRAAGGLTIRVSGGTGTGDTRLAAFDAALRDAGVFDYNLVRLSSVIPPASVVLEVTGSDQVRGPAGHLLYCVYADSYAEVRGHTAWAGMAWGQADDGSGRGMFVEHDGESEESLRSDLELSLAGLMEHRGGGFSKSGTTVASITCADRPVCALVLAAYRTAGWQW